jgi:site-specific DNA-methyltransferase (adenine-specific)
MVLEGLGVQMDLKPALNLLWHGDLDVLVIQGDCLEILELLPPSTVHLTVMDPAYESLERHRAKGTTTRLKESKASSNKWFTTFPNILYWELFRQLHMVHLKDSHCYVFCDSETEHVILSGRNPMNEVLDNELRRAGTCPTGLWTVWPSLVWVKTKRAKPKGEYKKWSSEAIAYDQLAGGMGYHWRRTHESILFLEKGKRKLSDLSARSVLFGPKAGKNDFPTEKPICVLTELILNSSNEGEIVLDCFAGSGNTGRAAVRLGRKAILIDLDVSWMEEHPLPGNVMVLK